jgi:hypothetical protein
VAKPPKLENLRHKEVKNSPKSVKNGHQNVNKDPKMVKNSAQKVTKYAPFSPLSPPASPTFSICTAANHYQ